MRLTISAVILALLSSSGALAITTATSSFQNGINGYAGTFDRYINDQTGDTGFTVAETDGSVVGTIILNGYNAGSGAPPTRVAATPDSQGLIRFDDIFGSNPGQIPLGAFILDAQLQLVTAGGTTSVATGQTIIGGFNGATSNVITGSVGPFGVSALKTPFGSTTSYYTSFPNSAAKGPYYTENAGEYATRPVAGFGTAAVGQIASSEVTSLVQMWSSGTLANNGFAVQAGFVGQSDDWHIHTTGYGTPEGRPKLSVTYTTDPVTLNTFQPGVGTYADASVTMARVIGGASPATEDGSLIATTGALDGADGSTSEQLALVKFSNIFGGGAGQAAADKQVAKAWLVLTTAAGAASRTNDPYDVDIVRQPWTVSTLYNQFGANPGLQFADGDVTPTLDRVQGMANGSEAWYDVTSYLESVRNGATDNGLAIKARGTDGMSISFNGATDTSLRPRLVVASVAGLFGDFNNDTNVDSTDYVIWRQNDGPNSSLPNDNGVGNQASRYSLWRANFGKTSTPSPPSGPSMLVNYDVTGLPASSPPATWNPHQVQYSAGSVEYPNSSQTAAGITALPLSRGAGLNAAGLSNGFSAQDFTLGTSAPSLANAIANNDYFQFGLTVDANHTVSLSTVDFPLRRSATNGPMNFELQASTAGGFGSPTVIADFQYLGRTSSNAPDPNPILTDPDRYMTLDSPGRPDSGVTPGDQITTIDLTQFAFLQNVAPGTTVTFRLYGWGNASTVTTNTVAFGRMNGPLIKGSVATVGSGGQSLGVPEPSSFLLASMLVTAFVGFVRRRK